MHLNLLVVTELKKILRLSKIEFLKNTTKNELKTLIIKNQEKLSIDSLKMILKKNHQSTTGTKKVLLKRLTISDSGLDKVNTTKNSVVHHLQSASNVIALTTIVDQGLKFTTGNGLKDFIKKIQDIIFGPDSKLYSELKKQFGESSTTLFKFIQIAKNNLVNFKDLIAEFINSIFNNSKLKMASVINRLLKIVNVQFLKRVKIISTFYQASKKSGLDRLNAIRHAMRIVVTEIKMQVDEIIALGKEKYKSIIEFLNIKKNKPDNTGPYEDFIVDYHGFI